MCLWGIRNHIKISPHDDYIPHVDVEDQEEQETVLDSFYPLYLVLKRETSLNWHDCMSTCNTRRPFCKFTSKDKVAETDTVRLLLIIASWCNDEQK